VSDIANSRGCHHMLIGETKTITKKNVKLVLQEFLRSLSLYVKETKEAVVKRQKRQ
jgi:hypothetical protein